MVALDLNRKRVYIRGDIIEAYSWLSDLFDAYHMMRYSFPFTIDKHCRITPHPEWTVEHNPKPLSRRGRSASDTF